MGFISVKCPSCGSSVDLDETREYGFCSYCGTKIVQDRIVVEHRGSISISGVANEQALLERAFLFLEDGDFSNADIYFEKVLDVNPKCSRAYIGKLLCEYRLTSISQIDRIDQLLKKNDFFLKAKRFATPKELKEYEALEEIVFKKLNNKLSRYKKELKDLLVKKEAKEQEVITEKANRKKYQTMRIVWIILIVVFCLVAVFSFCLVIDCFFGENPVASLGIVLFILLFIPSCVGIVFAVKKKKKSEELIKLYFSKCKELASIINRLQRFRDE